jgi:hypothetical protein
MLRLNAAAADVAAGDTAGARRRGLLEAALECAKAAGREIDAGDE